MSAGEFCDYWTWRRVESQQDRPPGRYTVADLGHLDSLGYALAADGESHVLLTELEETNHAIAQLRSRLSALERGTAVDEPVFELAGELREREDRRRQIIGELDGLPARIGGGNGSA
jgi:hypothetical protein